MILPSKHVRMSESLIGIGALVLESLGTKTMTLAQLQNQVAAESCEHPGAVAPNLDDLIAALIFLNMLGLVSSDNGRVKR